jgi:hypothetical protein
VFRDLDPVRGAVQLELCLKMGISDLLGFWKS